MKWNKELVLKRILVLHRADKKLNVSLVYKRHRNLLWAAQTYWHGWRQAIVAAGLNYSKICLHAPPQRWDRSLVLTRIKELRKAKIELHSNFVQRHHQLLYAAAKRHFGSWGNAIKTAGFDYNTIRVRRPFRQWDKPTIIRSIKSRHRKGLAINSTAVSQQDRGLYSAAKRHIKNGGWSKALRLAGFDPNKVALKYQERLRIKRWVIREIQKLYRLGVPLYGYWLLHNGYAKLYWNGRNLFGNWGKAITTAGLNYANIRALQQWSERKVITEIRKLERRGIRMSQKEIRDKQKLFRLFQAAILRFGSWGQAVEAAGFDYRKHCSYWTYKSWLRNLTPRQNAKIRRTSIIMSKRRRVKQ